MVFASVSERAAEATLSKFIQTFNNTARGKFYKLFKFRSFGKPEKGVRTPIYHTNVMMGVLANHVVVCLESVADDKERARLRSILERKGKEIIDISFTEMGEMCGNIIQVRNNKGELCVIMSKRAYNGFTKAHRATLEKNYRLIVNEIPTIERIGGGSARCMVAELYE